MKILFIRPRPDRETIGLQHLMLLEPLELEILYTLIRPEDTAEIIDLIIEKRSFAHFISLHNPDVICFTGYITNVAQIIAYAAQAKAINEKIVNIAGGVHCEVCPEDFEHECIDYRVVRNAARVFTKLLNHIAHNEPLPPGVLQKNESTHPNLLPPFDFSIPFPNREAVKKYRKKYFYIFHNKVALLKTSFGCPFACSFCFCRVITGGKYVQRPMQQVIEEIKSIHEKEVYIVDDDFLTDHARIVEFISEIRKVGIKKRWLVYGRADFIAANPVLMKELKSIGLRTVIVGFESFTASELNDYNKKISADLYAETMQVLRQNRIECFATLIVSPAWSKEDFKHMVKQVINLGIHYINLQPLTPLPKTGLVVPDEKIIIDRKDYPKWDLAHVSVKPEKMAVHEFYEEILKAYYAILYRPEVIFKHLISYSPRMLYKMFLGGRRVGRQYREKIKEALKHA